MQSNPTGCPCADIQNLILLTPLKFPPTNTVVEPHEYFTKWKTLDPEALLAPMSTNSWIFCCEICTMYYLHLVGTNQYVNTIMLCTPSLTLFYRSSHKEGYVLFAP